MDRNELATDEHGLETDLNRVKQKGAGEQGRRGAEEGQEIKDQSRRWDWI